VVIILICMGGGNEHLEKLGTWSKDWLMSFNVDKCKVMHMGKQRNAHTYYLNGQAIASVKEETDLGVIIN